MATPPGSPSFGTMPPPAPLCREGPKGPDPYKEDREEAREKARKGAQCPVNQHGCMYFSASEWVFCPMCEWSIGHREGVISGALVNKGTAVRTHYYQVRMGETICISREGIDAVFKELKTFQGLMNQWTWEEMDPLDGRILLTHTQMHNLLMEYGAPSNCLTQEVWTSLQERFPTDDPEKRAARKVLADELNRILKEKERIHNTKDLWDPAVGDYWHDLEDKECQIYSALDALDKRYDFLQFSLDEALAALGAKPYHPIYRKVLE